MPAAPQGCGLRISWRPVSLPRESVSNSRRGAVRDILLYGVCGGVLIVILKLTEYRFLFVEHSVEIYGALVATLFAGLGIWLGLTLTKKKPSCFRRFWCSSGCVRIARMSRADA
jgi:hypothetical protein